MHRADLSPGRAEAALGDFDDLALTRWPTADALRGDGLENDRPWGDRPRAPRAYRGHGYLWRASTASAVASMTMV